MVDGFHCVGERGWRDEITDKGACYNTLSHLPVSGFGMNRGKSTTQRKLRLSESELSSLVSGLSLLYCMCRTVYDTKCVGHV